MAGVVTPLIYAYTPLAGTAQHNLAIVAATKLTVPNGAMYATVQAKVATLSYTTDGTTPTAGVGMTLAIGNTLTISGYAAMAAAQFISATGTLDVEFFA